MNLSTSSRRYRLSRVPRRRGDEPLVETYRDLAVVCSPQARGWGERDTPFRFLLCAPSYTREYWFLLASSSPRLTENVTADGDIRNKRDKSAWLTSNLRTPR